MSRRNLSQHVETLFQRNIEEVKHDLRNTNFVCTTADVWSAKRRSFLGVTAHWIDAETFERKSVALACRKFGGENCVIV